MKRIGFHTVLGAVIAGLTLHAVKLARVFAVVTLAACAPVPMTQPASSKIAVDLSGVNADGLRGPPTGLRAAHYEFCIPAGERYAAEVRSVDPTVQFMPGSRGRIGCSSEQVLVLGNTHQRAYRQVLDRLAALDYVGRIAESFFE